LGAEGDAVKCSANSNGDYEEKDVLQNDLPLLPTRDTLAPYGG
jgi:hypothetical protein